MYFQAASAAQMRGNFDEAIALYQRPLACMPTAEAHTLLGWALSCRGDYEGAILACHRAIEIDPGFGNPYNDIGSYLIARRRTQGGGALAREGHGSASLRTPALPHVNLARIYVKLGHVDAAIAQLRVRARAPVPAGPGGTVPAARSTQPRPALDRADKIGSPEGICDPPPLSRRGSPRW